MIHLDRVGTAEAAADPATATAALQAAYDRTARWRLAAVYAYRPAGAAAGLALLDDPA